jgi:hypothetical protein
MSVTTNDDKSIVGAPESKIPPLGCRPRFIVAELRARELVSAMERYFDAGKSSPDEWHEELAELNEWLGDHGYMTYVGFKSYRPKVT